MPKMEPVYCWLGATMTELREARGLTQREVARRMGLDHSAIAYFEQGKTRAKVHRLVDWCKALDVDPVHVFARALEETAETEQDACRVAPKI